MFEKPMNQDLGTDTFGNRVHLTNRPPMKGVKLATVDTDYVNPRNNVETVMEGVSKDSDRTVRHVYYDRSKVD